MICADTSFLISLYGTDTNTPGAKRHSASAASPLHVHAINDFEFRNAVRLLVFRRKITRQQRRAWLVTYEADKTTGNLLATELDANAVLRRAEAMSAARTETGGHRGYDVLLIAAAKILGATEFWSFDGRQRALAATEGLTVGP